MLIPFIASSEISHDAWTTLATTYAKLTRGWIMQLKGKLTNPIIQGMQSITKYMQEIKSTIDSLTLMNVPVDSENITIRVLNGLNDNYKELSNAIQARDFTRNSLTARLNWLLKRIFGHLHRLLFLL